MTRTGLAHGPKSDPIRFPTSQMPNQELPVSKPRNIVPNAGANGGLKLNYCITMTIDRANEYY
jgi:hypothetical protein